MLLKQQKRPQQPSLPKVGSNNFMTVDNIGDKALLSINKPRSESKRSSYQMRGGSILTQSVEFPNFLSTQTNRIQNLLQDGMKHLKACDIEKGLKLLAQYLESQAAEQGQQSQQFIKDYRTLLTQVQQIAMKFLNQSDTQQFSIIVLQWAQQMTKFEETPLEKCKILNNLGCAYRRIGKLQQGLNSMEQALELVNEFPQIPNRTVTYLNFTTILSQMGQHERALKCAFQGVKEAQSELTTSIGMPDYPEKCRYMGISMYNIGVEQEALENYDEAVRQFKKSYEFIRAQLGRNDPLYLRFHEGYERAKQKIQDNINNSVKTFKVKQNKQHTAIFGNRSLGYQTEDSISINTPQNQSFTNRNNLKQTLKNNFFEDEQIVVQNSLLERGNFLQKTKKKQEERSVQQTFQPKSEIEQIGLLQWTDSEPDEKSADISVKPRSKVESVHGEVVFGFDRTQKDDRLNFLQRLNLYEKEEAALKKQEEAIIQEVENDLYDVGKIIRIQSYFRMKKQQVKYRKLKAEKRKQGKLDSDDYKIRKLQRFIRKKLMELKIRRQTRLKVKKFKLRRYPIKEVDATLVLQTESRKFIHKKHVNHKIDCQNRKGFIELRLARMDLIDLDEQQNDLYRKNNPNITISQRLYKFKFHIQYPDHITVKFILNPIDKKLKQQHDLNYELQMETEEFLFNLGMLNSYIEILELTVMEETPRLYNLRALYTISRQFLNVSKQGNHLKVVKKYDSNKELEIGLMKIGQYLQQLVRVKQNQIIIIGITDFDYQSCVIQQGEEFQVINIPFYLQTEVNPDKLKKVIKLQSRFRGLLARRMFPLKKLIYRKTLQRLTLQTSNQTIIVVNKTLDIKSGRKFIFARVVQHKRNTNELFLKASVIKQMGMYNRDNFFEIFSIDTKAFILDYSEEAQYWLQKSREDKQRNKIRITDVLIAKCAKLIQKAILQYLYKRKMKIELEMLKRVHYSKKRDQQHKVILKKVAIQKDVQQNKRAYLQQFTLFTDFFQKKTSKGIVQLQQQSVQISVKTLEHLFSQEKVLPFYQKLFAQVDVSELISISGFMIDQCRIIKGKQNALKVDSKSFEEMQGILLDEQNKKGGVEIQTKKDETLMARRRLNIGEFRKNIFFKNQSTISYTNTEDFRTEFVFSNAKYEYRSYVNNENFIKVLQIGFKNFKRSRNFRLKLSKNHVHESDHDSIKNYVKNYMPTSEYSSNEIREVKKLIQEDKSRSQNKISQSIHSKFSEDDELSFEVRGDNNQSLSHNQNILQKKNLQNQILPQQEKLFEKNIIISKESVSLTLMYTHDPFQITVIVEKSDDITIRTVIHKHSLLCGNEPNLNFLRNKIDEMIISQLNIEDNVVYFKPNRILQIALLKEQTEFINTQNIKVKEQGQEKKVNLDPNKRTIVSLQEQNFNIIELAFLDKDNYDIEFVYDYEHYIYLTIYDKVDFKLRKVIKFSTQVFHCKYINEGFMSATTESIQRFFRPTILCIVDKLYIQNVINHEQKEIIFTNWLQIKPILQMILKDQCARIIQKTIVIHQLSRQFQYGKKQQKPELFILRMIECYDMHYTDLTYVLNQSKKQLKIYIRELNSIDATGNIVEPKRRDNDHASAIFKMRTKIIIIDLQQMEENYDTYTIIENMKRRDQVKLLRLDFKKIIDHRQKLSPQQYRNIFRPFLLVLHKNLHVSFPNGVMQVRLININLPYEEIKEIPKKRKPNASDKLEEFNFPLLLMAAVRMQKAYKRMISKEWFQIKQKKKKEHEEKTKHIGQFIKRGFRNIEGEQYLINIYKKPDKRVESFLFTFEVILYSLKKDRINPMTHKKGYFSWEPTMMLNIGQQSLCDYLMDLVYIDNGLVRFHDSAYSVIQPETQQNHNIEPILETEEEPERLVHHQIQEENKVLYNVVYTGTKSLRRKKISKQQEAENEESNKNTLKIEVNLQEVKKLYPTLNTKNRSIMKIIGQKLTEGIKIGQEGQIMVDQSKITPTFIKVYENNIKEAQFKKISKFQLKKSHTKSFQERQQTNKTKPTLKEVLVKKTTLYSGMKYLIIISYLERRIAKILHSSKDEVFEDYESIYQVYATNLIDKQEEPIIWDMSSEEAQILSHQVTKNEIGLALAKRMQVLNGKFIFLVQTEQDILSINIDDRKVILFVEKAIKPIQIRFKNKRFIYNYRLYRKTLEPYRLPMFQGFNQNVAYYDVSNLKSNKWNFIVFCCEDQLKVIKVYAWSTDTLAMYEVEIPKQKYIYFLSDQKIICMRCFVDFIEYNSDLDKITFSNPNIDLIQERYDDEKRRLTNDQDSPQLIPSPQLHNSQAAIQQSQDHSLNNLIGNTLKEQIKDLSEINDQQQ